MARAIAAGETLEATAPLQANYQFLLGGLFNLSGLPAESLAGANYGIGRILLYRKIGRGGEGVREGPHPAAREVHPGHRVHVGDHRVQGQGLLG